MTFSVLIADLQSTQFSFNNDFGRSRWLERMGGPIATLLRKNRAYMRIHKDSVSPVFETKQGVRKLKRWFRSQNSLDAKYRLQS